MDKVAEKDMGDGGNDVQMEVQTDLSLTRKDFHHPFTPYKIQEEFMETVYRVLEGGGGRVGILESPTGTVCVLSTYWFLFSVLVFGMDLVRMKWWVGGGHDLFIQRELVSEVVIQELKLCILGFWGFFWREWGYADAVAGRGNLSVLFAHPWHGCGITRGDDSRRG
jgi:hypothetical protein